MPDKEYLIEIEGNEALLERFIEAINKQNCKSHKNYPNPYLLPTGELFLNSSVINYFFKTRPFSNDLYVDFFEKLRRLEGFNKISYTIGLWIKENITKEFYEVIEDKWNTISSKKLKSKVVLSHTQKEILSFICYVAVCHIKYGASYESITANDYFNMVTELGSNEVKQLKKFGTGKLPKNSTEYKDSDLTCKANDVFATIKIRILNNTETANKNALIFINKLLKTDFPKSYEISFSSKEKEVLPIKGLPKCGQNHLFASVVKHPSLHSLIEEYIDLAKNKWEWYNNLEDENCAMPSTFAVFALAIESDTFFDIAVNYFQNVDEEHQSIQQNFTLPFLQKFGVNARSIKVYINCILSMQEQPHNKKYLPFFYKQKCA